MLVVYELAYTKNINSLVKAQLLHVDLTDQYEQMTISMTIANTLINDFKKHFTKGLSVSISNFFLKQKLSMKEVMLIYVSMLLQGLLLRIY